MTKKILILKKSKITPASEDKLLRYLNKYKGSEYAYKISYFDDIEMTFPSLGKSKIRVKVAGKPIDTFDFVYFRSWYGKQPLATALARYLDFKGIEYIDEAVSLPTHGNKLLQAMLLGLNDLPIPKTFFFSRKLIESKIDSVINSLGLPLIMKDPEGHKGMDNFLIKNKGQILRILKMKKNQDKEYLFQEYIPNKFDYRILVFGNYVGVAIKRTRTNPRIHQNNAALGAVEEFFDPKLAQPILRKIAIDAAGIFKRAIVGVDIIVSDKDNKPYIVEVNPAPGFTYDDSSPEVKELDLYLRSLL